MSAKFILLILITIVSFSSMAVKADTLDNMSDEALASYISSQLNQELKGSDYKIKKHCDDNGCSIVVQ